MCARLYILSLADGFRVGDPDDPLAQKPVEYQVNINFLALALVYEAVSVATKSHNTKLLLTLLHGPLYTIFCGAPGKTGYTYVHRYSHLDPLFLTTFQGDLLWQSIYAQKVSATCFLSNAAAEDNVLCFHSLVVSAA
jgi:hypothetical protein